MNLTVRRANIEDMQLFYEWANDSLVRSQSFYSDKIELEDHKKWFNKKIQDSNTFILVFEEGNIPAGQVRIEISEIDSVIGISIAEKFRGKGLGTLMLEKASEEYFNHFKKPIMAYIKLSNLASARIFEKAGFVLQGKDIMNSIDCVKYILTSENRK